MTDVGTGVNRGSAPSHLKAQASGQCAAKLHAATRVQPRRHEWFVGMHSAAQHGPHLAHHLEVQEGRGRGWPAGGVNTWDDK